MHGSNGFLTDQLPLHSIKNILAQRLHCELTVGVRRRGQHSPLAIHSSDSQLVRVQQSHLNEKSVLNQIHELSRYDSLVVEIFMPAE
jgi:hypothetical protein